MRPRPPAGPSSCGGASVSTPPSQLKLLLPLVGKVRNEAAIAQELGLSPTGYAIYGLLPAGPQQADEVQETRAGLAADIDAAVAPLTAIVDWRMKEDVQRQIRRETKKRLRTAGLAGDETEAIAADVLLSLRAREDR